ncbi:hypothetical protein A2872_00845 [Candidatus Gottesmanbacteria bacterium RIFCSPHIGHO2_01_FULL_42_12]|uniref:Uncharacterized protein n=1 Tax=Candidatus Gottesmanbacteria bacterium RIFCSPHIGHO2_01_FULL_42_12 TaxID=1798377 RepID=A0A1F5Z365_9BACT|nr:MAG: hypothetical protein A2872_00845 [Candidatus Gottesmanbacteria bacterium RIFCSPHIGHO2_01_FULL_42_12]
MLTAHMPLDTNKIALRGSTQDHLEIEDIRDDIIILKDGSCALIIQTSAVNFGLLSQAEQEAIIYAYAGLLNSLTFAVQIVIRSKRKDISSYVAKLDQFEAKQENPLLKNQIAKYKEFVVKTVKDNNVLDKKFYIIIPFSSMELGVGSSAKSLVKQRGLPLPKEIILEKAKVALSPKAEHLYRLMGSLGLKGRQMTTPELIELFFDAYNPNTDRPNVGEITSYTTPIVTKK